MSRRGDQWGSLLGEFEPGLHLGGASFHQWILATCRPVFWVWLGLAAYWLARGLHARSSQLSLGLPELMNELGLTLWIAGALLAPVLERGAIRSRLYFQAAGTISPAALLYSFATLQRWLPAAALALVAACFSALLPYRPGAELMLAASVDPIEFRMLLLPTCVVTLLLGGTLAVLVSCSLHTALRRWFGPGAGLAAWLIVMCLLHWQVLSGWNLLRTSANGNLSWIDNIPLSLGQQFVEVVATLRSFGTTPPYMNETVGWVLLLAGGMLALAFLLQLAAIWGLSREHARLRLLPALLSAGTLVPAAVLLPWLVFWVSGDSTIEPDLWTRLCEAGLVSVWATAWLAQWRGGLRVKAQPGALTWLGLYLALPICWLLLSAPLIRAGAIDQTELLWQAAVLLLLLPSGLGLISLATGLFRHWPAGLRSAAMLALLVLLCCPLSSDGLSLPRLLLETLPGALASSESRLNAALILLVFVLLALAAWLTSAQRRHAPRHNAAQPQRRAS